ncbi:hypothetical protein ST47_g4710 [Ascochyta rabiei]|uniref:Uncharacterized protein n=1 Tax=Didymella rabiei TaxID=5454 RepID=A0A163F432_DIDRA|nr:hypothetical protein ST47_g4710 [Ascochyta rabiei]
MVRSQNTTQSYPANIAPYMCNSGMDYSSPRNHSQRVYSQNAADLTAYRQNLNKPLDSRIFISVIDFHFPPSEESEKPGSWIHNLTTMLCKPTYSMNNYRMEYLQNSTSSVIDLINKTSDILPDLYPGDLSRGVNNVFNDYENLYLGMGGTDSVFSEAVPPFFQIIENLNGGEKANFTLKNLLEPNVFKSSVQSLVVETAVQLLYMNIMAEMSNFETDLFQVDTLKANPKLVEDFWDQPSSVTLQSQKYLSYGSSGSNAIAIDSVAAEKPTVQSRTPATGNQETPISHWWYPASARFWFTTVVVLLALAITGILGGIQHLSDHGNGFVEVRSLNIGTTCEAGSRRRNSTTTSPRPDEKTVQRLKNITTGRDRTTFQFAPNSMSLSLNNPNGSSSDPWQQTDDVNRFTRALSFIAQKEENLTLRDLVDADGIANLQKTAQKPYGRYIAQAFSSNMRIDVDKATPNTTLTDAPWTPPSSNSTPKRNFRLATSASQPNTPKPRDAPLPTLPATLTQTGAGAHTRMASWPPMRF